MVSLSFATYFDMFSRNVGLSIAIQSYFQIRTTLTHPVTSTDPCLPRTTLTLPIRTSVTTLRMVLGAECARGSTWLSDHCSSILPVFFGVLISQRAKIRTEILWNRLMRWFQAFCLYRCPFNVTSYHDPQSAHRLYSKPLQKQRLMGFIKIVHGHNRSQRQYD